MLKEVKKDMLIGDILEMDMTIAPILMASGMHCVGCPASAGETLEEAVGVHGLDADELVSKINEFIRHKARSLEREAQEREAQKNEE
ncbi:MAG: DUF1858 domain-containing protein [Eubacterium sp.]|nr:DUF1858 domain-containing protein [Eubacterium sp.]